MESFIHNIAFSREKVVSSESGAKDALIKSCLQAKTVQKTYLNKYVGDLDVREQQRYYGLVFVLKQQS